MVEIKLGGGFPPDRIEVDAVFRLGWDGKTAEAVPVLRCFYGEVWDSCPVPLPGQEDSEVVLIRVPDLCDLPGFAEVYRRKAGHHRGAFGSENNPQPGLFSVVVEGRQESRHDDDWLELPSAVPEGWEKWNGEAWE
jgi:hypothetical protein